MLTAFPLYGNITFLQSVSQQHNLISNGVSSAVSTKDDCMPTSEHSRAAPVDDGRPDPKSVRVTGKNHSMPRSVNLL